MSMLERFAQGGGLGMSSRSSRELQRIVAPIVTQVKEAEIKAAGAAYLADCVMDDVVHIDMRRRRLAGDDPSLNAALTDVELNYLHAVSRIQRNLYNQFR